MRTYNDKMFIDSFEHDFTWLNGFLRNVSKHKNRPAIIDPEQKKIWTYAEVDQESNRLANALKEFGVKKNDVIMVALRNCPEFVFAYVGARKTGAILLAANFNLASGEMAHLIKHNKPKIVFYSADAKSSVESSQTGCSFSPELFVLADNLENSPLPENHILYEDFVRGKNSKNFSAEFRPHIYDEVLRLCTSGTTSLPKCVPVNDVNEVLTCHDVIMHCALNFRDVTLNMTPWFHRGGCHAAGVAPIFYAGGAVCIMRKFQPRNALSFVEKFGVTYLIGSPSNLNILSKMQQKNSFDLSSLRGLITMGSPLFKDDCIEYMKHLTPNIFNGYGTTESFWNSILTPDDLPVNAGSAGASCLDDEIRLVKIYDEKKAECSETIPCDGITQGEVIVKSPKSSYAYFDDEKNSAQKFYDGWIYTGDAATWDENKIITIKGRKDDMMVVSGENIYPSQIESVISAHEKISDCAAVSVPDKIRGESVAVYIVPKSGEEIRAEEISKFCRESPMLSKYKRPRFF